MLVEGAKQKAKIYKLNKITHSIHLYQRNQKYHKNKKYQNQNRNQNKDKDKMRKM